jgi:hypothetical protein
VDATNGRNRALFFEQPFDHGFPVRLLEITQNSDQSLRRPKPLPFLGRYRFNQGLTARLMEPDIDDRFFTGV